jgi:hypothetical protein
LKIDLVGIVPGSQQSPEILNWFQDEIIAVINRSLPEEKVGAKILGVPYRWIPHSASFGFLDLTPSILLLRQFWD